MLSFTKLAKRPKVFQRFTGLTIVEFETLYDKFFSAWLNHIATLDAAPGRKRAYGTGRKKSKIPGLKDKLVFILIYVRIYPLQFIQGFLFDMAESRANEWIHRLLPLLEKALGYAHVLPKRGRSLSEVLESYPELKELGILTDGVERPTKRSKDNDKQKRQYSGKKKRHTVKNVVTTNPKSRMAVHLTDTVDGSQFDKTILEEAIDIETKPPPEPSIPTPMGVDLGFLGLKIPGFRVVLPHKKKPKKELTDTQKEQNKTFSGIRIRVEHAIGGIKISRSVADTYRNYTENMEDQLINVATGLHNLRVAHRYIPS